MPTRSRYVIAAALLVGPTAAQAKDEPRPLVEPTAVEACNEGSQADCLEARTFGMSEPVVEVPLDRLSSCWPEAAQLREAIEQLDEE